MHIFDRMSVDLPVGKVGNMEISKFEVKHPDDWTEKDEGRSDVISPLKFRSMELDGRAPRPGWYTQLSEGKRVWMSDTTAERRDHVGPVLAIQQTKAERVLINGLGLGMVLTAALSYDHVRHVDVVEFDQRVIDLVGPHYLKDPRVRIHHSDAIGKMKDWGPNERWDVGWTDIWAEINSDNLPEMNLFTAFYGERCKFHENWSEDMAKRSVWDYRHMDSTYLKYLTPEDKERFYDEDDENFYDDEDGDE